jgi:hypothetical protein
MKMGLFTNWFKKEECVDATPTSKKEEECDHIFRAVEDLDGNLIGQQCAICPQFNSLETVLGPVGYEQYLKHCGTGVKRRQV